MGEDGSQESQANDESVYSVPPYIRTIGGFFTKPSGLAWSGGALVVTLGLALVLLFFPLRTNGVLKARSRNRSRVKVRFPFQDSMKLKTRTSYFLINLMEPTVRISRQIES